VNVATFYDNLWKLYEKYHYVPLHIWNCDEMGAQARRIDGGRMLGKKGAKNVYSIIPNECEWLSVLYCINGVGGSIPNF
jgi:hypothetical protein